MPLLMFGIVLDSAPAVSTYWRKYNAVMNNLPNSFVAKIIGPVTGRLICFAEYLALAVYGYGSPEHLFRETLLTEDLIKSANGNQRGCHAKRAREQDWIADAMIYEDTSHVKHLAKHREEYMDTVKGI
ncbi:hypothetical protein BCR34DRAFT_603885 [Clohesyomyces aquaticus]|uniref:Uncharacterized protein n=1 Tax=Clohesyomyces aquaticus TaxID=1231657 RepID=A0A1Y1ZAP5_9PLEO|nr:hypothetical protein BCR34DRAFT_603885 [Clohesyomyces aquaticus]